MTQADLGRHLGELLGTPLPRQSIFAAEQGKRQFTAAELVAFAYVLGGEVNDFFRLPVGESAVTMPSGSTLTREDLQQSAASGASAAIRLREELAKGVQTAHAAQGNLAAIEHWIRKLHDELDEFEGQP